MRFTRYAIFYTPAPGPLASFGAAWLGWNAEADQAPPPPDITDLPLPLEKITKTPRRYGFHGTIKPPFRLARDQSAEALQHALAKFCSAHSGVFLDGMTLAQLGRFLALVPVGETGPLNALAADAIRSFDRFRAPPDESDLARRRQHGLSPRQETLLQEWGYPFVMEEFRFHLTLTGRLPMAAATRLRTLLEPHLTPLLPRPFAVDTLCLMGEDPDGMFRLIERFPLSVSELSTT